MGSVELYGRALRKEHFLFEDDYVPLKSVRVKLLDADLTLLPVMDPLAGFLVVSVIR